MPGKDYGKKSSGFKMGGMSFMGDSQIGGNTGLNRARDGYQGNPSAFPLKSKPPIIPKDPPVKHPTPKQMAKSK